MAKNVRSVLKAYVRNAKQRLLDGEYDYAAEKERRTSPERTEFFLHFGPCTEFEIESLYDKVCNIALSSEFISNPIGRLVDERYLETLSEMSKQRYILKLSEVYLYLMERFKQGAEAGTKAGI